MLRQLLLAVRGPMPQIASELDMETAGAEWIAAVFAGIRDLLVDAVDTVAGVLRVAVRGGG
ncbi:hypothetical protein [Embleya sp. NBC_00896]|uniref:hypothetical protein n=1 Tax=Embleya sp. NBC_00896 TaxID=2975961 RepID=UPI00386B567E|nr:hypothetical protein OG928_32715 [Embleya sp. NBC_00896]